jgi:hypothetical protein
MPIQKKSYISPRMALISFIILELWDCSGAEPKTLTMAGYPTEYDVLCFVRNDYWRKMGYIVTSSVYPEDLFLFLPSG